MVTLRKYLLIFIGLLGVHISIAQDANASSYTKFPLKIAIGNHAVGFPFQNSFNAFNLHLSLGTELGLNKNLKHSLFLSSDLGYISNGVIGSSINLNVDFVYRYTHKTNFFLETALGIGMLNQFHPRDIYALNESDGTYDKISDNGTIASLIGFKTALGYDFSKKTDFPFRIAFSHHFFIQTAYFDLRNFPIMPQSSSNILISYKFKK